MAEDFHIKNQHGVVRDSAGRGFTFQTSYGKDSSDVSTGKAERMDSFGGGPDDVSHSLSGARANNEAK